MVNLYAVACYKAVDIGFNSLTQKTVVWNLEILKTVQDEPACKDIIITGLPLEQWN